MTLEDGAFGPFSTFCLISPLFFAHFAKSGKAPESGSCASLPAICGRVAIACPTTQSPQSQEGMGAIKNRDKQIIVCLARTICHAANWPLFLIFT